MSKKSIVFIILGIFVIAAVVLGFVTKPAFLFPKQAETPTIEETVLPEEPALE